MDGQRGSGLRQATTLLATELLIGSWSPDGRRLAYVSNETGVVDIYVLDLGSGAFAPLTAEPAVEAAPAFTSNGQNVVFTSNRSGVELLWRSPAAGPTAGSTVQLVSTPNATSAMARPEPRIVQLLPDFEQRALEEKRPRPTS